MRRVALCPTTENLLQLLDGELKAKREQEIDDHLNHCADCRQRIENLAAGEDSWLALRSHLRATAGALPSPLPGATDPIVEAAVQLAPVAPPSAHEKFAFLEPAEDAELLGKLGRFEIIEFLGCGGMGIVFKGRDPSLQRIVAVKVLAPLLAAQGTARKRFIREAQAAAAVAHENVVPIYAVEENHSPPFLVMQYIEGCTLDERIQQRGEFPLAEVLRLGIQIAAGLAAAHSQGLIHRDIKPANILLENGIARVKITDFGLAYAADDARLTQSGYIAGTPQYMAPEQARGDAVDNRADLFSLGCVLYVVCTGRAPFRGSTTLGVLRRVCEESPKSIRSINPEIPEWLTRIIARLMAKKPEDRFSSAAEVAGLLGQCLAHVQQPDVIRLPEIPLAVDSADDRAPLGGSFWPRLWMTAIVFAGLALPVAVMFWPRGQSTTNDPPQRNASQPAATIPTQELDDSQPSQEPTRPQPVAAITDSGSRVGTDEPPFMASPFLAGWWVTDAGPVLLAQYPRLGTLPTAAEITKARETSGGVQRRIDLVARRRNSGGAQKLTLPERIMITRTERRVAEVEGNWLRVATLQQSLISLHGKLVDSRMPAPEKSPERDAYNDAIAGERDAEFDLQKTNAVIDEMTRQETRVRGYQSEGEELRLILDDMKYDPKSRTLTPGGGLSGPRDRTLQIVTLTLSADGRVLEGKARRTINNEIRLENVAWKRREEGLAEGATASTSPVHQSTTSSSPSAASLNAGVKWDVRAFEDSYTIVGTIRDNPVSRVTWVLAHRPRVIPGRQYSVTLSDAHGRPLREEIPLDWTAGRQMDQDVQIAELDLDELVREAGSQLSDVATVEIRQFPGGKLGPHENRLVNEQTSHSLDRKELETGLLSPKVAWSSHGFQSCYDLVRVAADSHAHTVTWTLQAKSRVYPSRDFFATAFDSTGRRLKSDISLRWSDGKFEGQDVEVAVLDVARLVRKLGPPASEVARVEIERFSP